MSSMFHDIQPAVKKETRRVAVITAAGTVIMWVVFFGLHMGMPEKVPFDYTVILGGLFGSLVAVLNFFHGSSRTEGCCVRGRGGCQNAYESKLLPENADSDALGGDCDRSPLFSVCGRHSSPFIPGNRH